MKIEIELTGKEMEKNAEWLGESVKLHLINLAYHNPKVKFYDFHTRIKVVK